MRAPIWLSGKVWVTNVKLPTLAGKEVMLDGPFRRTDKKDVSRARRNFEQRLGRRPKVGEDFLAWHGDRPVVLERGEFDLVEPDIRVAVLRELTRPVSGVPLETLYVRVPRSQCIAVIPEADASVRWRDGSGADVEPARRKALGDALQAGETIVVTYDVAFCLRKSTGVNFWQVDSPRLPGGGLLTLAEGTSSWPGAGPLRAVISRGSYLMSVEPYRDRMSFTVAGWMGSSSTIALAVGCCEWETLAEPQLAILTRGAFFRASARAAANVVRDHAAALESAFADGAR